MNNKKFFFTIIFSSTLGAFISGILIFYFLQNESAHPGYDSIDSRQKQVAYSNFSDSAVIVPEGLNFIHASKKVIPGVVHIRSAYSRGEGINSFFRGPAQSTGSGVIISDDGFIATNYHVIQNASQIEVVLNDNRSYYGKVVGKDPTTDLALVKIKANNLPFVKYGNSDELYPGEWVLAIGNPFDLNSTVTAGIVSAKARNIGILRDRNNLQIESFIQTDAAVNPGNSGGALVNLNGELIGINTAIATPTGNYAGYSFAVPVTLVKKVMDDLLEFGEVQRGLLGIRIGDVNAQLAEARGLSVFNGVFVSDVNDNSAAEEAGLLPGDVITGIDDQPITNVSELQELVARNRPGDKISVTYLRDGNRKNVTAILKNFEGESTMDARAFDNTLEGATFQNQATLQLQEYDLEHGVLITDLKNGKWKDAGIKEGFIITSIDKIPVSTIDDLHLILENKAGGILVEGVYQNGKKGIFGMSW